MKPKDIIISLFTLAIVVGGFYVLLSKTQRPQSTTLDMNTKQSSVTNSTSSSQSSSNSVSIKGFAYASASIKIKKGTTVTWTNQDEAHHTVTADSGSPAGGPTSELLAKGQTYSQTFNSAGIYKYHCEPHPYMKGTVEVTD